MAGFRTALATGPWQVAVESCLATLGPEPGGRLGFLYATDHLAGALPAILEALTKGTGTADWVGTVGLGVAGQDAGGAPVEPFDQPALAVMLTDLPADSYRLIDRIEGSAAPFAAASGAWLAAAQPTLGLVHGDPRNPRSPAIVADIATATGAYLVGGLTASRAGLPQLAGKLTEGGVSGVLFAQGVGVATGLSQGCTPIGPSRLVTDAEQTIVEEVMTSTVVSLPENSNIEDASDLMEAKHVRRLVVTDDNEVPVGIVSMDKVALLLGVYAIDNARVREPPGFPEAFGPSPGTDPSGHLEPFDEAEAAAPGGGRNARDQGDRQSGDPQSGDRQSG